MAQLIILIETDKATSRRVLNNLLALIHSTIHHGLINGKQQQFNITGETYGVNYKATIDIDTDSINKNLQ